MTLLLDTGPVVAAIDRSDHHHARCAALLESVEGPLLVPTTVIVEVCWLVEERPDIEAAFLDAVAAGEFEHVPLTGQSRIVIGITLASLRNPYRSSTSRVDTRPLSIWLTRLFPTPIRSATCT